MSNVVVLSNSRENSVDRVSVHIAEYSAENGGVDPGHPTLFAVEVLFPDGTWTSVAHGKVYASAYAIAVDEAEKRNAVLLDECYWPNRRVTP